jgi:exodeoxyribonuclease V alpha subunit
MHEQFLQLGCLICADPIHGGFRRKEDHTLECDLLVVDETSMIDVPLIHALLKAVPLHRRHAR